MISLVARRRPLLFFSLPGALLAAAGMVVGFQVILTMGRTGTLLIGSTVLTTLLLLVGLLMGVSGVILHSIGHLIERLRHELGSTNGAKEAQ